MRTTPSTSSLRFIAVWFNADLVTRFFSALDERFVPVVTAGLAPARLDRAVVLVLELGVLRRVFVSVITVRPASLRVSTISHLIMLVVTASAVLEVRQRRICRITIFMTNFCARQPWTDERFHDHVVHVSADGHRVLPLFSTACVDIAGANFSYSAQVGHLVSAFTADDRLPGFFHESTIPGGAACCY